MSNLFLSTVIIVLICFQVSVCWVVQTHNSNNDMTNEITDEDGKPIGDQRLSLIVPGKNIQILYIFNYLLRTTRHITLGSI